MRGEEPGEKDRGCQIGGDFGSDISRRDAAGVEQGEAFLDAGVDEYRV